MTTEIATVSENTELTATGIQAAMEALSSGKGILSTFQGEGHEDKLKVLTALTNSTPLEDVIGKKFLLQNYVVQEIELTNEQTGELEKAARIILVDDKGVAYHAVSGGILKSLTNIATIMGQPHTWASPIPVTPVKMKAKGPGHFFTLNIG